MKKLVQKFYATKLKPSISCIVSKIKIFICMMRKNRRIHTILEELTKAEKEGERDSKHGESVTVLGRSRSNLELHLDTNIRVDIINDLCFKLINMGYIKVNDTKEDDKVYRFNITLVGRVAVIDQIFLNKVWWRNFDLLKWLVPTLISIGTGVIALLAYFR